MTVVSIELPIRIRRAPLHIIAHLTPVLEYIFLNYLFSALTYGSSVVYIASVLNC